MAEKDFWMASGRFAVPEAAAWATQPYHMGVRVLVCAGLFDQEAPYSQGLGLGVAVNRPPIPKTLYYAGTITKEFVKKGEVQVCFEVDKSSATSTSRISTAGSRHRRCSVFLCFPGQHGPPIAQPGGLCLASSPQRKLWDFGSCGSWAVWGSSEAGGAHDTLRWKSLGMG